jgi:hypothetical protein
MAEIYADLLLCPASNMLLQLLRNIAKIRLYKFKDVSSDRFGLILGV